MTTTTSSPDHSGSVLATLRGLVPRRPLRFHEALRIAELQANRFRELLDIGDLALPEEAITDLPRIHVVRVWNLPVSGLTHWEDSRWQIALNADEPEARQRFSLAHELFHVLAHTTQHWLQPDQPDHRAVAKAEHLADFFAGCLLMPKRYVKRLFGQRQTTMDMAASFEVSVRAMEVRLSQLGLNEPRRRCAHPLGLRPGSATSGHQARRPNHYERQLRPRGVLA